MNLTERVRAIEPEIYDVFCRIHRHPELGHQERETSALLERELTQKAEADRIIRVAETGLLVELRGTKPGREKRLGLRADIDALPIQEPCDREPHSEIAGVMHACGHDAHASILLGAVRTLAAYRNRFSGSIFFFFQPAEEPLTGAKAYLADPAVDLTGVKDVAALHVLPDLPAGQIGIRRGPMLGGANDLIITIRGKQGHASKPNEAIDPIAPAAAIIQALQHVVAKELHPADPAVISINSIHSGVEGLKIIPGELRMTGSVKTLSPQTRAYLLERIPALCEGIAASMRCEADVVLSGGPPPLICDPEWTARAQRVGEMLFGAENVRDLPLPSLCSEDFSYFMEGRRGVFVRIGSREPAEPYGATHNPAFRVARGALTTGMLTLCGLALDFFGVANWTE